MKDGTLFKQVGYFTFSDYEWLVVTDFSLQQLDGVLGRVEEWLRKTLLYRFSNRRRTQCNSLARQKFRKQYKKEPGFQQEFLAVQGRCNALRSALQIAPKRARRGLLDVGGHALNWLFGVATDKDLQAINDRLKSVRTSINRAGITSK